jgi:hypothetical protein
MDSAEKSCRGAGPAGKQDFKPKRRAAALSPVEGLKKPLNGKDEAWASPFSTLSP